MTHARILAAITSVLVWTMAFSSTVACRDLGEVPAGGFRSPGITEYIFRNPREGWVYVRVPKPETVTSRLPIAVLDGAEIVLKAVDNGLEAMRYMSEGPHTVGITYGTVNRLEVRAIGELFYAAYGSNPHIPEMGNYTWAFLRRYCLNNFNGIIGDLTETADGKMKQEAEIKEWTSEGKRWFTLTSAPDEIRVSKPANTADEAIDYWTKNPGMTHPLISGVFGDEFGPRQAKYFPAWSEALRRIHADPRFSSRKFYAYSPNRYWPLEEGYEVMFPFVRTIMDCGYRLVPEWYLVEGWSRPGRIIEKTKDLQAEFGPEWEMASRESFERASPGAATNRIVAVGILTEPGWEKSDLFAQYDFNVFLDCQIQFLATDPAFFGTRGLQGYLSSYCGEEQLRLFAKLVRHYAIEGKIDRVLKDNYVLPHLQNPDFEKGLDGWTLSPAVSTKGKESIVPKTVPGFGTIQAKYHAPAGTGDKTLWTKRSSLKPNKVSQKIRDLVPGRLYSLRFITGDYQEFLNGTSVKRKHALSVRIENVELVT
ncbi:MAG: hypothetical protein Q7J68_07915, partial [Thermoplasmata archaeon]|nr:hypothetical protein [Thermoplasmata archaeon]